MNRFDEALADQLAAVKLEPKNKYALSCLGTAHDRKGDFIRSVVSYTKSIEQDATMADTYANRFMANVSLGKADALKDDFTHFVSLKGWRNERAAYLAVISAIAERKTRDEKAARAVITEAVSKCDPALWPYPILWKLQGDLSTDELLRSNSDEVLCCHSGRGQRVEEPLSHLRRDTLAAAKLRLLGRLGMTAWVLPRSAATLLFGAGVLAQEPVLHWDAGDKGREFARADDAVVLEAQGKLKGADGATLEVWVLPRRAGEQVFAARGLPEIGAGGERFFKPAEGWVNFFVGTDAHGFLMGAINGNSWMPFPLVTLEPLALSEWHQVVAVKQPDGFQRFHHNGALVHSDRDSEHAGQAWPFIDEKPGEPLRLAVPLGGALGEVLLWPRSLSAEEIAVSWEAKRARYVPSRPAHPVSLAPMHEHPPQPLATEAAGWERERARILAQWTRLVGPMPKSAPPLDPQQGDETDCGAYVRRKVSFQVQPGDRMPCWLLVPKTLPASGKAAAIICFYGTTSGAGKDTTVGVSGGKPRSPPVRNRAFAIDMAEAGFVALAPDFLRDGERVPPSGRPYDTTDFYDRFPEWSIVGKDCWDVQRAVDFLETLPFVDAERIAMVGHSYGGHTTIFAAGLEPRIKAVFASGPVSDFVLHGMHWAVPKSGGASQSLPAMRPYLLDHRAPPVSFAEVTALIAPRPLWVNQAVGEWRPNEEENAGAVGGVYRALGAADHVRYMWCAGDHDFPPAVRAAAVDWFKRWLRSP